MGGGRSARMEVAHLSFGLWVGVCVGVGVEEGRGGERGRVLWGKRVVRRERRMGAWGVGVRRLVWMVWERNLDWFRER